MTTASTYPLVHELFLEAFERFFAAPIGVRDAHSSSEPNGSPSERGCPDLPGRVRADLDGIHARLEPIEQLRAFALFGLQFAASARIGEIYR